MSASFQFLHLSDFHVGVPANRRPINSWPPALPIGLFGTHDKLRADGVVRLVRELTADGDVDALVLTGDIAATGSKQDILAARQFVFGQPASPKGRSLKVASAERPILLLPGNHDRYRRLGWPDGDQFDRTFRRQWRVRRAAQCLGVFRREGASVALLAADFTLTSRDLASGLTGMWGQGRVSPRVLTALVELTRAVRLVDRAIGVIWCVHFPPGFDGISAPMALQNEKALSRAAAAEEVGLILCGHTHERRCPYPVLDATHVLCAGSCCAAGEKTHSAVLASVEIESGKARLSELRVYQWDHGYRKFLLRRGCAIHGSYCTHS